MDSVDQNRACSYCGLPLAQPFPDAAPVSDSTARYCCWGCQIAAGIMLDEDSAERPGGVLAKLGLGIFFSMNVMVFTLVLWSWNVHDVPPGGPAEIFHEVLRYACLLFATPVLILLGGPLAESSWHALRAKRLNTDTLLFMGVCAAFGHSTISLILGFADVYFEVACMTLVAVTLGKWFEATAKLRATQSLQSMTRLLPEMVRRVIPSSSDTTTEEVPLGDVRTGDLLQVRAGERFPVDGIVESDFCSTDEKIVTGESAPRMRRRGEAVFGGTVNLTGQVLLRATTTADKGTIGRLLKQVETAIAQKCAAVRSADQLAAWFVPLVLAAAAVAFAVNADHGLANGIMASLAVALIACPCALGIATPLALWVAIHSAARRGVLFRGGDAVLALARVKGLAFDKTGTITSGDLEVDAMDLARSVSEQEIDGIAAGLASASTHPICQALLSYLTAKGCHSSSFARIDEQPGVGLFAWKAGHAPAATPQVMLGNPQQAAELGFEMPPELMAKMNSRPNFGVTCLGMGRRVVALFFFREETRLELASVVTELKQLGLQLAILSGDRDRRAATIGRELGVNAIGQLRPEEKVGQLNDLPQPAAMVGDGLNDAPALAVAHVGIAMGCGADLSREAADVCLVGNSLAQIPWAIRLARNTQRAIRRNLVWSFAYNIVGIALAMAGLLNPIVAAIAMVGSSLFVLTNSLALAEHDRPTDDRDWQALAATRSDSRATARFPLSTTATPADALPRDSEDARLGGSLAGRLSVQLQQDGA